MGNQLCCQQTNPHQNITEIQITSHTKLQQYNQQQLQTNIKIPQLSETIVKRLNQFKPFEKQFSQQTNIKIKKFANDVYQGHLNQSGKPQRIGKMYKQNSAYFIGYFENGFAQGPCFYVMKNGTYYKGNMKNNQTQCQNGIFESDDLKYQGSFKNNQFNGKGKFQLKKSMYIFQGIFSNGKKAQGVLKWGENKNIYIYDGSFDQNQQFTKFGKLTDSQGRYEGNFLKGMKNGFGIYYYNSKLRYEGNYISNKKQGQGTLFNCDDTIAYKGQFKNGLPNGKGYAVSKTGVKLQTQWIDGLDSKIV